MKAGSIPDFQRFMAYRRDSSIATAKGQSPDIRAVTLKVKRPDLEWLSIFDIIEVIFEALDEIVGRWKDDKGRVLWSADLNLANFARSLDDL